MQPKMFRLALSVLGLADLVLPWGWALDVLILGTRWWVASNWFQGASPA